MSETKAIPTTILAGRYLKRCGYCQRSARRVKRLVAVPGGYVCDVCVGACAEVLMQAAQHPIAPEHPKVVVVDVDTECAVCETVVQPEEIVMVEGRGGPVCKVCVEALVNVWFAAGDQGGSVQ